jgi:thiol-disulfide isomerase/thioredoxin
MTEPTENNLPPNTTDQIPQPDKKKATYKYIKLWGDRLLNVVLVFAILSWAIQKFTDLPTDKKSLEEMKTKRLEKDASRAFGLKQETAQQTTTPQDDTALWVPPLPEQPLPEITASVRNITAREVYSVIAQEKRPVILFIYASWCKYCNAMYPILDATSMSYNNELRFATYSIDDDAEKYLYYLKHKIIKTNLTTGIIPRGDERSKLATMLAKKGLQFTGSIPYMAIFYQQTPVAQFSGYIEPSKIRDILSRASSLNQLKNEPENLKDKDKDKDKDNDSKADKTSQAQPKQQSI